MPAYLSQIAAGASAGAGSRRTLSPAIRSRSPIAERDQRLTLTDMDWNFEDNLGSEAAAIESAEPMEPVTRLEPAIPEHIPAESVPHPLHPAIGELPPEKPDSRHRAHLTSTSNTPRIPHPLIQPSATPSNTPRQDPKPLPAISLASPEHALKPTGKSSIQSPLPVNGPTEQPAQPERPAPQKAVPASTKADPGVPPIVSPGAPQASEAGEPIASARDFPRAGRPERRLERPQVMELPPLTEHPTARNREQTGLEPSTESTRPSVIINHIEVEVVPPAEKSTPKPVSPATPRSAFVSQIGPLQGVAKHLAFSIRHR
ncbi:MAG TPA: hypothetical protein VIT91_19860 [Chthoniobacterales bacterium]